ncbi:C-factor [Oryzias melastigma]|uniref:C-factor n=1 Tax=Oryzias melastigma TaxID=30732 RepID=A0A3B3DYS2_ORYME|nr:C-factor isoform X1 [Oryzias melastigma]KAF6716345.1 C-factor [Oryzias melastigma]
MSVALEGNILVTGTSRGIGLELVRQLAQKSGGGAHIYACCREPEGAGGQALRQLSAQHPGKISIIKLDVADEQSISAAVEAVKKKVGASGLNLLINNAAINKPASPASLLSTGKKDMMEVFETNVAGPFLLTKMLHPLLQSAAKSCSAAEGMSCRRAAVINVSTLLSSIEKCPETFAMAQMYPYRTSKAALNMLTSCQAENFRADNILVAAVHPGWVRTDMGGEQAPLTTEDSVLGMIRVLSTLSSKHSGKLLDWEGNSIPW